ncbi:hypothetical protein [Streptomyces sp. NPDC006446]|uniref:hypothetical protein n=1 Tax=Streptomyces sp. NPDC006446 TaxID=3154301 RepID=UPI0033BA3924
MVPIGAALVWFGWYGDGHGWWVHRPFVTNLLSSLTGLMFGIPLALFVLARLSKDQADVNDRADGCKQAEIAVNGFVAAWHTGVAPMGRSERSNRLDEWRSAATYVRRQAEETWPQDHDARRQMARELYEAVEERNTARDAALDTNDRQVWITLILQQWQRIDRDLQPRLVRAGLPWLSASADVALRNAFSVLEKTTFESALLSKMRGADLFKPPYVPDSDEHAKAGQILVAEAIPEIAAARALKEIVQHFEDIEGLAP